MMREVITAVLLLSGCLFVLIAAIGIVRLPDVLCRAHALTKAMTIGISLLLLGLWVTMGEEVGLKIGIAIAFQFLTIPVGGHLLGLTVLKKRLPRWHPPVRENGSGNRESHTGSSKSLPAKRP